ncbi:MAG: uroporphyrinogen-III C-methyltransferase [Desulforegulaceae bacterium]|nr:uroporphyrinogen-III C-methyltransferase [Desulforegulaceae bacterium]
MGNNLKGFVYLVGAGPGDPELLTIKGKKCIEDSDVLVYDYLASKTLLRHAKENTEKIYVGKKGGDHTLSQDGINNLLVKLAIEGKTVCRLKGGDPFIFGRGGEEAEVLKDNNIEFEIVPGVTSAISAPAYAGIPLTHRSANSTLAIVTGHENPTKKTSSINWESLAKGMGTIVFLMGVKNLPNISKKLIENGKDPQTPVGLIRWGTTPSQETIRGTLENIAEKVKKSNFKAPAIIVVGEVVNYRDKLKWFEEKRPLLGKKIMITRARAQASSLVEKLLALGADCIEYPTIKIIEPDNKSDLFNSIEKIKDYSWLIFTSVNGVKHFFDALFEKNLDLRILGNLNTAVIGPATRDELKKYGINSDVFPKSYRAESIIEAFENINVKNKKILIPKALEARSVLPDELRKMGALVDEVTAYKTIPQSDKKDEILSDILNGKIDIVTFTSSSTVKNFKALFTEDEFKSATNKFQSVSIGPITTDTAIKLGINPEITAEEYTIDGLVDSILKLYKK